MLFHLNTGEEESRIGDLGFVVLPNGFERGFGFKIQGKLGNVSQAPFGFRIEQIGLLKLGQPTAIRPADGAGQGVINPQETAIERFKPGFRLQALSGPDIERAIIG